MTDHEALYRDGCRLLLSGLVAAGRAARALQQIKQESDPQFLPDDCSFFDVDDVFSPTCQLIRKALALGIVEESDEFLVPKPYDTAPNYRAVLA